MDLIICVVNGIYVVERAEVVKDLKKQIEHLVCSRSADVSKALIPHIEEIDFLKAELMSTKVRLHDALSHSQAEKDALIRHADARRLELMQLVEELQSECQPVSEAERQYSDGESLVSPHISRTLGNQPVLEIEAVNGVVENLWKTLALLRELVLTEKDKWNLLQTDVLDSEHLKDDAVDGTVSEVARGSQKIRSSWGILEVQVLPLIEKICTALDQVIWPGNSEGVKNSRHLLENGTVLHVEKTSEDETVHFVRQQLEEEKKEIIHLKEVMTGMQILMHIKDEALREMESKCGALQVEFDAAHEQLQSQVELAKKLSENVESSSEQLMQQTNELSYKHFKIQQLHTEAAELKVQITEGLFSLQADCDGKLETERKIWQAKVDAKTDEFSAKCTELKQQEWSLKTPFDEYSMLAAERDEKATALANSDVQIDELTKEINVVREQLRDKSLEIYETQTNTEYERNLLKDDTQCETEVMESKIAALEYEIKALQEQLESKTTDLVDKGEELTLLEHRTAIERENFVAEIADLKDQLQHDHKASVEKLNVITSELKIKDALIKEHEESHATNSEHIDAKLVELTATVSAKESEIKSLQEHHMAELQKCEMFYEDMSNLTSVHEAQVDHLNSLITELMEDKLTLQSELQLLTDKLKASSESAAQSENKIEEPTLVKEEFEGQLKDLHYRVTAESEHATELQDEQKIVLKSALSDEDYSLSVQYDALSHICREDIQSMDPDSHTFVSSCIDSSKAAEVLDAGACDAGYGVEDLSDEQVLRTKSYGVQMIIDRINSLGAADTILREKIGADLLQIKVTSGESPERQKTSCSLGTVAFLLPNTY